MTVPMTRHLDFGGGAQKMVLILELISMIGCMLAMPKSVTIVKQALGCKRYSSSDRNIYVNDRAFVRSFV